MTRSRGGPDVGWQAALLEIEHQAEHWATPDHGQVGELIAAALRASVQIARAGGLRCEHREPSADAAETPVRQQQRALQLIQGTPPDQPARPPSAA